MTSGEFSDHDADENGCVDKDELKQALVESFALIDGK